MLIEKINLFNFRNYEKLSISFSPSLNIIYGLNGSGKTNLVEAIYLLSLTKSFRISNDKKLIKKGALKTRVSGEINKNNDINLYEVELMDEGKNVYIDNNKLDKISDYIAKINIVLFNPSDTSLINDTPEKRRKLLNIEISQLHKEYLIILSNYQKILKQRNFYLRSMYINGNQDMAYLDILTKKLIEYGKSISKYREEFINNINLYISDIYEKIFQNGIIKIRYVSDYKGKDIDTLFKRYKSNYAKELSIGKTIEGIHHDDMVFILDNNNLKEWGSEGQKKNAIISFKLAEINVIKNITSNYPILILDDLFSELDQKKINNIFKLLDSDVQTFITTTEINKINKKYLQNAKKIKINNGIVEEEKI